MRARFRRIHLQYVSAQQQLGVTTLHLCMLAPIQRQVLRGFIVTECKCRAWKKIYGHSYCTVLRAIDKGALRVVEERRFSGATIARRDRRSSQSVDVIPEKAAYFHGGVEE